MKPDFALSLSFEGIGLLTRVADGWHLLGEVTLDTQDLAAELDKLRAQAETLANGQFATAVVLPNDQIKYITLDTGRARDAKRREMAVAALEESTPYSADQLAFDLHAAGRNTQVAAVARETLDEAEAFATEHAFNPVCFTAIPPEGVFDAAPEFGTTKAAATLLNGAAPGFDTTPIRITGKGPLPNSTAPAAEPAAAGPAAQPPEPAPPPRGETVSQPESAPDTATGKSGEATAETAPATPPEPPEAAVSFASIRARRDTADVGPGPGLGGATRAKTDTNAPSIPLDYRAAPDRAPHFDPKRIAAGLNADAEPRPQPEDTAASAAADRKPGTFLSRRSNSSSHTSDAPSGDVAPGQTDDGKGQKGATESQRMTIFGARSGQDVRGKPKYLGLVMTAILLLFLAAVAVWAALYLEDGLAGLFRNDDTPRVVMLDPQAATVPQDTPPTAPRPLTQPTPGPLVAAPEETARVETDILEPAAPDSITDSAEVEAMIDAELPAAPTEFEAESRYAVTGIWERAPLAPVSPTTESAGAIYATSIDRVVISQDAVALPDPGALLSDTPLLARLNPAPLGTRFDLDERGLVTASEQGTLSPDGILVFAGQPPVLPSRLPDRSAAESRAAALPAADTERLASVRPRPRPGTLQENSERASLGGLSRNELARIRPRPRPKNEKEIAEADAGEAPSALAITTSRRPRQRPSNIAQLAQRAQKTEVAAATPAAATVRPSIPTTASVARQATIKNAIHLNKINLIGIYGTSDNRRALVRLANGRYRKVQVGDRIDGGKVAAIGNEELRYVRKGKNVVLKMPKG